MHSTVKVRAQKATLQKNTVEATEKEKKKRKKREREREREKGKKVQVRVKRSLVAKTFLSYLYFWRRRDININ